MVSRSFSSFFPSGGYLPTRITITDLYVERDSIRWYWRIVATVSSWLILAGYIVAPFGLHDQDYAHLNAKDVVLRAVGTVLLILGYLISIALTLICRSWLFWQEAIFAPTLSSSLLGLLSVILSILIIRPSDNPQKDFHSFRAFLLILPSVFIVLAALLVFFVSHRIHSIRSYDRARRMRASSTTTSSSAFPYGPDSDAVNLLPESEQQRQQLLRLLLNKKADKPPSPDLSQSTYRIDLPIDPNSATSRRPPGGGYLAIPESRGRRQSSEDRSVWQLQNLRNLIPGSKEIVVEGRENADGGAGGRSASPREARRAEIERGGATISQRPSQETISSSIMQTPPVDQFHGGYI